MSEWAGYISSESPTGYTSKKEVLLIPTTHVYLVQEGPDLVRPHSINIPIALLL